MRSDVIYDIALTMAKGVGPVVARRLINSLGCARAVLEASRGVLEKIPGVGSVIALQVKEPNLLKRAEKELFFLEKIGGRVLAQDFEDYPYRLKECEDSPILLYQKGKLNLNVKRSVGIVGTRKMTQYGRDLIVNVVKDLAKELPDCLVVSGLAHGVDGLSHRSSVELGLQTVGVVGHGLDMIYPAEHRTLAEKMMSNGGLLTEFHSNCVVDRKNFVSRNRIIAGLSDVVLVVESGEKGGALLTADFAASYNRDVCAFPGRVGDAYSKGCNMLIKENRAVLVENAGDIIRMMNWDQKPSPKEPIQLSLFVELDARERLVVQLLEMEGRMHIDQMSRRLQWKMNELSTQLFELEMKDLVRSFPGGVYGLK